MPNFGDLINYRCQEMPRYGTIRLLWPCQPCVRESLSLNMKTSLCSYEKLNASENLNVLKAYLSRTLEFEVCLVNNVKLWRKMIYLVYANK